jgi:hypothetical protein
MEIMNGTPENVELMFDGVVYAWEPGDVMSVSDEAGTFLAAKGRALGLVQVGYGDNPEKKTYESNIAKLRFWKKQVEDFDLAQAKQAETKLPALPETFGVRKARMMIPLYEEKVLPGLRDKLKITDIPPEVQAVRDRLAAAETSEAPPPVQMPMLEDATIEDLRALATNKGISVDARWNSKTLIAKIRQADSA